MSTPSEGDDIQNTSCSEHPIRIKPFELSSKDSTTHQTSSPSDPSSDKQNRTTSSSIKDLASGTSAKSNNGKTSKSSNSLKRNAFSELMTPKSKQQKTISTDITNPNPIHNPLHPKSSFSSGLLPYITRPNTFPPGTIIRETDHIILIRDLYPKSLIHLLLLSKDPKFYNLNPFEAFNPPESSHTDFLTLIRTEANSAANLAASELSRLIAPHSQSCQARNTALSSDNPPSILPPTRDFLPEIKIGIHAAPSMDTLHVHIISVDNYSPALKTKKHYNSFNTDFFINLEDFPLMEGDVNMTVEEQESLIKGDMKCWRCGRNFGNKFKQLKEHLQEEYEEWRKV